MSKIRNCPTQGEYFERGCKAMINGGLALRRSPGQSITTPGICLLICAIARGLSNEGDSVIVRHFLYTVILSPIWPRQILVKGSLAPASTGGIVCPTSITALKEKPRWCSSTNRSRLRWCSLCVATCRLIHTRMIDYLAFVYDFTLNAPSSGQKPLHPTTFSKPRSDQIVLECI